ncbi:histone-lysine N-methyltransferase SETMAR [Trichonephila clavipes]|nr:histone-lysine N-methyltransferase SETMAR [Trichonephila clavipes]
MAFHLGTFERVADDGPPIGNKAWYLRYSLRRYPNYVRAAVAEWYRYRIVACLVTSSSPVPLKTRRVGQRCTLNLSRAETFSRWCGS